LEDYKFLPPNISFPDDLHSKSLPTTINKEKKEKEIRFTVVFLFIFSLLILVVVAGSPLPTRKEKVNKSCFLSSAFAFFSF